MVQPVQTQRLNNPVLVPWFPYCALYPGNFYFRHNRSTVRPVKGFGLYSPLRGIRLSYRNSHYFLSSIGHWPPQSTG